MTSHLNKNNDKGKSDVGVCMKDGRPFLIYDTNDDQNPTMISYFDAIQLHGSLLSPTEIDLAYNFFDRDKEKIELHSSALLL